MCVWGRVGVHVHAKTYALHKHRKANFHITSTVCASSGSHQNLGFSPCRLGEDGDKGDVNGCNTGEDTFCSQRPIF